MGGSNEKKVTSATTGKVFRIHENNGECHVHDDVLQQRFSCPKADFDKAWKDARASGIGGKIITIEGKNKLGHKSKLTLNPIGAQGNIDLTIKIEDTLQLVGAAKEIDDFVGP